MRVAVTGASGFVGGWVARLLARSGHDVFAFGRRPANVLTFALPHYRAWNFSAGPIEGPVVDAVVHCASLVSDWGTYVEHRAINVDGTHVVLASFPAAKRFVHVSTASVYASGQSHEPTREDAPLVTAFPNDYVRTKVEAERVVLSSGRQSVILRPHIVYGPGDTTLMPRVLAARRGGWIPVPGNGRNRLSVTHIFNFVHAVECVLARSHVHGIFNVADLQSETVDRLLRTMLERHGIAARIAYIPAAIAWPLAAVSERVARFVDAARAPSLTRYLVEQLSLDHTLDVSKAREHLGYTPRWTYRDGPLHDIEP